MPPFGPVSPRPVGSDLEVLTAFEHRALALFASGMARRDIAKAVHRAPKTISNNLTTAKEKLGARSLAEAAAIFVASLQLLEAVS